jgi:alpha-amylase
MKKIQSLALIVIFIGGLLSGCRGGFDHSVTVSPEASPIKNLATAAPTEINLSYDTPDWFKNAVLYEVYVRSFADSNGDGTGDLQGVVDKLDYIQSLGVDTIWLMPIYPSPSVHGYDVTDFEAVNPDYGTLQDLQNLVYETHQRGMHLILDFVPSHLSSQHPFFQDAYDNPESKYSDWFVWNNDAHTRYASFADLKEMPRFNHYNPEVVDYLSDVALYWLDLDGDGDTTDGVDGFRIDNATFPPQEFFIALRQRIKQANPQALMLGETWVNSPSDLNRYFESQFDALFDFPLYSILEGNRDSNGDGVVAGKSSPVLLSVLLQDEASRYPPQSISVRFGNNHDTNRIASEVQGNTAREKLLPALTAALPGVPMIYYGEEIGMFGQKGGPPDYDNYRREPMDWYAAENGPDHTTWFMPEDRGNQLSDGISVEEEDHDPESLMSHYRKVFSLRNQLPVLKNGSLDVLDIAIEQTGPWGFVRSLGDEQLLALYNFSDSAQSVTIHEFPYGASRLSDLLSGQTFPGAQKGVDYQIQLPPASAYWLVQADQ